MLPNYLLITPVCNEAQIHQANHRVRGEADSVASQMDRREGRLDSQYSQMIRGNVDYHLWIGPYARTSRTALRGESPGIQCGTHECRNSNMSVIGSLDADVSFDWILPVLLRTLVEEPTWRLLIGFPSNNLLMVNYCDK
jgi:hypothetical protein